VRLFVTVGNRSEPFVRLLELVQDAIGGLGGPVDGVCQFGAAPHGIRGIRSINFLARDVFETEMRLADAVVCHAGVGTLHAAMTAGHLPIVLARQKQFGECVNDHQTEIVRELLKRQLICCADSLATMRAAIVAAPALRGPPKSLTPDGATLIPVVGAIQKPGPGRPLGLWPLIHGLARFAPSPHRLL